VTDVSAAFAVPPNTHADGDNHFGRGFRFLNDKFRFDWRGAVYPSAVWHFDCGLHLLRWCEALRR